MISVRSKIKIILYDLINPDLKALLKNRELIEIFSVWFQTAV